MLASILARKCVDAFVSFYQLTLLNHFCIKRGGEREGRERRKGGGEGEEGRGRRVRSEVVAHSYSAERTHACCLTVLHFLFLDALQVLVPFLKVPLHPSYRLGLRFRVGIRWDGRRLLKTGGVFPQHRHPHLVICFNCTLKDRGRSFRLCNYIYN